jgi:hypothetical protein
VQTVAEIQDLTAELTLMRIDKLHVRDLLFDIIGEADALPVDGFSEKDFIMVGEGNTDFKLYLAAKVRPDGGREVFVSGLDVFSNRPQAQALLNDIVEWMLH